MAYHLPIYSLNVNTRIHDYSKDFCGDYTLKFSLNQVSENSYRVRLTGAGEGYYNKNSGKLTPSFVRNLKEMDWSSRAILRLCQHLGSGDDAWSRYSGSTIDFRTGEIVEDYNIFGRNF